MDSMQQLRMKAELRLWRAMLRSTETELLQAFAAHDRVAVCRLEQEARSIRTQVLELTGSRRRVSAAV